MEKLSDSHSSFLVKKLLDRHGSCFAGRLLIAGSLLTCRLFLRNVVYKMRIYSGMPADTKSGRQNASPTICYVHYATLTQYVVVRLFIF